MRVVLLVSIAYAFIGVLIMLYLNIKRDEYDDVLLDIATLLGWPMILYVIITEGTGAFDIEPKQEGDDGKGRLY